MHHAATCPTCQANALTRNHYFTGKLMVERDFTDEQHYFRERLRLHNQRLHGCGIACGLAVKQHPNPGCQDRYVLLEPGSAIDCCGNDILVIAEDTVDLQSFPAVKALGDHPDGKDHVLQLAIRYRECPTEEIPVLYDDCACDDSQCAPNRILESYSLDVVVDPVAPPATVGQPSLARDGTITIAAPRAVALDDTGGRVYVLASTAIYQIDASTLSVRTSVSLCGRTGLTMAISPDGKKLYVAIAPRWLSPDGEMWIYDTTNLATPPDSAVLTGVAGGTPLLTMTSQAQLVAAYPNGHVLAWNAGDPACEASGNAVLATGITGLAASSDGTKAWVAFGSSTLQVLDLNQAHLGPQAFEVPHTTMTVLAVLRSKAPDMLAAGDAMNSKLYVIDLTQPPGTVPPGTGLTGTVRASAALSAPPIAMVCAPGGGWLYVDDNKDDIEIIDIGSLLHGLPVTPPPPLAVGPKTEGLVMTASGLRLFVPYAGENCDCDGGVAVINITNADCGAALHQVRACPSCGSADCLVLATIRNYRPGWRFLDRAHPAPSEAGDEANKISRINDLDGRKLLASTETLQEVIECMLSHRGGGAPGPRGAPGPGLTTHITRIVATSWKHGCTGRLVTIGCGSEQRAGIVIGFSHPISLLDTAGSTMKAANERNIFRVEVPHAQGETTAGLVCSCRVDGTVLPVAFTVDSNDPTLITGATLSNCYPAPGLAFIPPVELTRCGPTEYWVRLYGEFVVDQHKNPIAADFNRAHFPSGDIRMGSLPNVNPDMLLGVPGGQFDSWFYVQDANHAKTNG